MELVLPFIPWLPHVIDADTDRKLPHSVGYPYPIDFFYISQYQISNV